jgi:hypothetical protein
MLLLGLRLAHKLLHTDLPPEVRQHCAADARLEPLAANISEHLFNGSTHVPATSREIFKYNLRVRKSLAARARYLVHILRPTDSDLSTPLAPTRFTFTYYLTRPFRLFFKA